MSAAISLPEILPHSGDRCVLPGRNGYCGCGIDAGHRKRPLYAGARRDGVIRLDTRTGAVSNCNDSSAGWACYAVPDERAAMDTESAGCRRKTKS